MFYTQQKQCLKLDCFKPWLNNKKKEEETVPVTKYLNPLSTEYTEDFLKEAII